MIRGLATVAVLATLSSLALANDPCPTCGNGVKNPGPSKPTCDSKIYPLSEWHYIKRYCGPVISPNATYGYHPTQWRAWDGQQNTVSCATPATMTAPIQELPKAETPKAESTKMETPKVESPKTDTLPKPMNPMILPGKEVAPKPLDKGKTGLSPAVGLLPAQPVSPGVYLIPSESK